MSAQPFFKGEAISGDEYLVILQVEANRKFELVYARFAKTRQNVSGAAKDILTIAQNTSPRCCRFAMRKVEAPTS